MNTGAGSVWERLLVTVPAACFAVIAFGVLWGAYWIMVPIWWWRRRSKRDVVPWYLFLIIMLIVVVATPVAALLRLIAVTTFEPWRRRHGR